MRKKLIVQILIIIIICLFLFVPVTASTTTDTITKPISLIEARKLDFNVMPVQPSPYLFYSITIRVKVTVLEKLQIEQQLDALEEELIILSKLLYREARGEPKKYQAAVIWSALNRVDDDRWPNTIKDVVLQSGQYAWVPKTPVKLRLYNLVYDVVTRWLLERSGKVNVGRVLPNDYFFFACGPRGFERFRKEYKSKKHWDWSLPNVYEVS